MTTPKTIRELIAYFPNEKWRASGGTVRIDSPEKHRCERICVVPSPAGAAPEAWGQINNKRTARAELIARLSPRVVIMVYDALKAARSRIVHLDTGNACESPLTLETINQSLSALDGETIGGPTNQTTR